MRGYFISLQDALTGSQYDVTNMRTRLLPNSLKSVFARPAAIAPLALAVLICTASLTAFAQDGCCWSEREHNEYSLASLHGSYAMIGTYAANVARGLGVAEFDGRGAVNGSVLVNQPGPGGTRTIVNVTFIGTYSVNHNGTGTMSLTVNLPTGTMQDVTEDFVITTAQSRGHVLIATAIIDAQEQPSVVISGNVFVTHAYTRRPD